MEGSAGSSTCEQEIWKFCGELAAAARPVLRARRRAAAPLWPRRASRLRFIAVHRLIRPLLRRLRPQGGLPPAPGGLEGARSPAGAPDRGAEARDPETFDDAEFYQTLLREFLESRDEAGAGALAAGPKQRRAVDRRASKGRKLRYHVHEKLINFVAPVELAAPQFAANVFANLFGGGPA